MPWFHNFNGNLILLPHSPKLEQIFFYLCKLHCLYTFTASRAFGKENWLKTSSVIAQRPLNNVAYTFLTLKVNAVYLQGLDVCCINIVTIQTTAISSIDCCYSSMSFYFMAYCFLTKLNISGLVHFRNCLWNEWKYTHENKTASKSFSKKMVFLGNFVAVIWGTVDWFYSFFGFIAFAWSRISHWLKKGCNHRQLTVNGNIIR